MSVPNIPKRRKLGIGDIRAHIIFACVKPAKLIEQGIAAKYLHSALAIVHELIKEGEIDHYVAFLEKLNDVPKQKPSQSQLIPGRIDWLFRSEVVSTLREKQHHASDAYRKKGMKSTHPPQFLTSKTLVIVMGSRRFLSENIHLYLEDEGVLRRHTFELLKEVTELEPLVRADNMIHLIIRDEKWYRGNLEALGRFAENTRRMTDNELLERIGVTADVP